MDRDRLIRVLEEAGVAPESERGYGQAVAPDVADKILEAMHAPLWELTDQGAFQLTAAGKDKWQRHE